MAEYIERNEIRKTYEKLTRSYVNGDSYIADWRLDEMINSLPSADVAPVRHGRWDSSGKYRFQIDNSVAVRCTECGYSLTEPEYRRCVWNYCPVCGAKMDLEV